MSIRLSRYFRVGPPELKARGVFDAFLGIDNRLFVDPNLLKKRSRIPEFADARQELSLYFSKVIKLLKVSKKQGDLAWSEAEKRLTFKEENGIALGYSNAGGFGRAVGPWIARVLVTRAQEIIELGIEDPEMFELIGLFQENIGSDLLSDMAISILKRRFLSYTERVTKELDLRPRSMFQIDTKKWTLPVMPDGKRQLIMVPRVFLSKLPVALDRSEIDDVAAFNAEVRRTWNAIVAAASKEDRDVTKEQIRNLLFASPKNLADLVAVYRKAAAQGYDFEKDADGLFSWESVGRAAAKSSPIEIENKLPKTIDELRSVVGLILERFKKNVEENRLREFLFKDNGKPKNERAAQLLFYAVADAYCEANNVDLSREPNAGNGPVDFKLSTGYKGRLLVEVKKSNSSDLLNGFVRQLPEYEKSEATDESTYLIIRVAEGDSGIKNVLALRDKKRAEGKKVPDVFVIDARGRQLRRSEAERRIADRRIVRFRPIQPTKQNPTESLDLLQNLLHGTCRVLQFPPT
jgi:hypothetical protein